jgi:hypothetical protein
MTEAQRTARFKELAERHTAKHIVSKKAARDLLISEGIYTKDGKISPEYGGEARPKRVKAA